MKTILLAAGVSAALLAQAALAQSGGVQVYGKLNLAVDALRRSGGSDPGAQDGRPLRLSPYRSVIGFRGDEDLGGDVKAVFQIEGTVAADTGTGSLATRDTRVGLVGPFGSLFIGNWVLPYNSSTAGLDPFYISTMGYMSIMGNGAAASVSNVSNMVSFDRRQQNSLHYWSPDWQGVTLKLAHGFNEESPPNGAEPSVSSAALVYDRGELYAILAHEIHDEYQGPGLGDRATKLSLARQFGQTRVGIIHERLHYETPTGHLKRKSWYASVSYQMGAHGIRFGIAKAQSATGGALERIGYVKAGPETGALHATLGYEYAASRRTTLFATFSRLRNDDQGAYDFAINSLGAPLGATLKATAVGLRHMF